MDAIEMDEAAIFAPFRWRYQSVMGKRCTIVQYKSQAVGQEVGKLHSGKNIREWARRPQKRMRSIMAKIGRAGMLLSTLMGILEILGSGQSYGRILLEDRGKYNNEDLVILETSNAKALKHGLALLRVPSLLSKAKENQTRSLTHSCPDSDDVLALLRLDTEVDRPLARRESCQGELGALALPCSALAEFVSADELEEVLVNTSRNGVDWRLRSLPKVRT